MRLEIVRMRHLLQIDRGLRETTEGIKTASLQQFRDCPLQGYLELGVGAETCIAAAIIGVDQRDIDDRVAPAERGIPEKKTKACLLEFRD